MNKITAMAIAAAISTTAGLTASSPSQAGAHGHFGMSLYTAFQSNSQYAPSHFGGYAKPTYGTIQCSDKWVRRWSPRRDRFIRVKKRLCWYD